MITTAGRRRYQRPARIPDDPRRDDALLRLATEIHKFRAVTLPPGSPLQLRMSEIVDALRDVMGGAK